ncbi:hypothetical protein C1T17_02285 [Sphingobium sp. SCG-1]|nr:hypothetical protein C1T17_02285 [Sphingobium sp. SCG-1]
MIASGHIALYRDAQAGSIRQKLAFSRAEQDKLRQQNQQLDAEQRLLEEALSRAKNMPARTDICPRCLIWIGREIPLSPVPVPAGEDDEVDYFTCSERCGFDNLP